MTILITAEKQSENLSENPPYYLEEKKTEKKIPHIYILFITLENMFQFVFTEMNYLYLYQLTS